MARELLSFGERLRKLRRDKDIMQGQLAEYLGIKAAAVSKWETAENAFPNVETLIKVADYFNVSTDYLLRGIQSSASVVEGNINGSSLNNSVVQTNVQSNVQAGVVLNSQLLSPEISEIVRIYKSLNGKGRFELSQFAFGLEKKSEFQSK